MLGAPAKSYFPARNPLVPIAIKSFQLFIGGYRSRSDSAIHLHWPAMRQLRTILINTCEWWPFALCRRWRIYFAMANETLLSGHSRWLVTSTSVHISLSLSLCLFPSCHRLLFLCVCAYIDVLLQWKLIKCSRTVFHQRPLNRCSGYTIHAIYWNFALSFPPPRAHCNDADNYSVNDW